MLARLRVEDLAVIRRADLALGPGLTVITGESGAGKSLLLRAVDLAAGGRGDAALVREGREAARVEAEAAWGGRTLRLGRELRRDGRGAATLDGRPARLMDLREAAAPWLGGGRQGDVYRLRAEGAMAWLDRVEPVPAARAETVRAAAAVEEVRAALRRVGGDDTARRLRRAEELRQAVAEIEEAAPAVGERERLRRERERLRNVQRLAEQAAAALEALRGEDGSGAYDRLAQAAAALRRAAAWDEELAPTAEAVSTLAEGAMDAGRTLARYLDGLAPDPTREEAIAARLDRLASLSRRYGEDEAEILRYAERARVELEQLERADEEVERLRRRLAEVEAAWREAARRLSGARREAARSLEVGAAERLRALALPQARLFVRVESDGDGAVSPDGVDRVEVLFAADAGAPLLPLADVASGGEASRVLLALEAVLAERRPGGVWVFDEVEAGVGGEAAWDVARVLWRLSRTGQVVLVTHLAPVAAMADVHLAVRKAAGADGLPESRVERVEGEARVAELARMLSGRGEAARRHAAEIMATAARERAAGASVQGRSPAEAG
ncbi:MAG: AAA family ATPase [Firmicutes bacterium]|nr:AAA family ATPase [Bacillota bacterium]